MTLDEIRHMMSYRRRGMKMTLDAMAAKSGYSANSIGRFEHGGNINILTLLTYVEVLGMEIIVREKEGK